MSEKNLTILDKSINSKYIKEIRKVISIIVDFGLTENESKICLLLGKYGSKTPPEIGKMFGITRGESYRLLNQLEKKGLVKMSLTPNKSYSIISPNSILEILIDKERDKIKAMEKKLKTFLELWKKIPNFAYETRDHSMGTFQTLSGITMIHVKIQEMIAKSKKEVLIVGTEKDFRNFYRENIFEHIKQSNVKSKIIGIELPKKTRYFKHTKNEFFKNISEKMGQNQCFIISDNSEVLFFIRDPNNEKLVATWTNSKSMINSFRLLFDLMSEKKIDSKEGSEFEIKELKQEKIILKELNNVLQRKILVENEK